jgi:hypothetical protein
LMSGSFTTKSTSTSMPFATEHFGKEGDANFSRCR